jgi:quercetin dioxygenase-like cupin family protein
MQRAFHQPTTEVSLYGGIFLKTWTIHEAGTLLPQHAHRYDHLTLVVSGAVRVWADDVLVGDFRAREAVKIPALVKHKFLTLTGDVVLACIHATEAAEVEIAEEHNLHLED